MSQDILWDLARNTMKKALDLGADEATVSVGRDTEISHPYSGQAGAGNPVHQPESLPFASGAGPVFSPFYL